MERFGGGPGVLKGVEGGGKWERQNVACKPTFSLSVYQVLYLLYLGTLPPNRTLSTVRLQGNACLSQGALGGQPPQQSTARRWRRSSGPALEFLTERFEWCASEPWIFVHQAVGPTVRQCLLGVRGGADHLVPGLVDKRPCDFATLTPIRAVYLYIGVCCCCVCVRTHTYASVLCWYYRCVLYRLLGSRRTDCFCARRP